MVTSEPKFRHLARTLGNLNLDIQNLRESEFRHSALSDGFVSLNLDTHPLMVP